MDLVHGVLQVLVFEDVHGVTVDDQLDQLCAISFHVPMLWHVLLHLRFRITRIQLTLIEPLFVYFAEQRFSTEIHLPFVIGLPHSFQSFLLLLFVILAWFSISQSYLRSYLHMIKDFKIRQSFDYVLIETRFLSYWISIELNLPQICQGF